MLPSSLRGMLFKSMVDKGLIERLNNVLHSDFARVTYTEAIELLEKNNDKFDYKVSWGCDLQTEHERFLTEQVFKRPVFVTDYPKEMIYFNILSASTISSSKSANAISGSIIQNSAACLVVLEFSALKVGPKV